MSCTRRMQDPINPSMPTFILLDLGFEDEADLLQASMTWARASLSLHGSWKESWRWFFYTSLCFKKFCKRTVVQLCMGCHGMCCTCSMQCLAELVFFQLQEAVLGRSGLDEPVTFYNLVENKE